MADRLTRMRHGGDITAMTNFSVGGYTYLEKALGALENDIFVSTSYFIVRC